MPAGSDRQLTLPPTLGITDKPFNWLIRACHSKNNNNNFKKEKNIIWNHCVLFPLPQTAEGREFTVTLKVLIITHLHYNHGG